MTLNSISGRFALLTIVFVLLAEVLILVPSVTGFRRDYLATRLERAQIASLALLATDESIAADLESELLENAGVFNVVLRRDDVRAARHHPPAAPVSYQMLGKYRREAA